MKDFKPLLAIESLMGLSLALIFLAYPIFPITLTADFSQHLTFAQQLAKGTFPSFSQAALYYGVEFYLGLAVLLFPANPLATVRFAMGLLVLVSPLVVYLSAKEIFQDAKAALWSAALYTLSGFVWYDLTFDSGLFPNFWGLLSALMLAAATLHFARGKPTPKASILLVAVLANALFSHYTVLLVFPPLMLYLGLKRNWLGLNAFVFPIVVGFILFPNLLTFLLAQATQTGVGAPYPTFLASLMPLPVLSFMVSEISVGFFGDLAAFVILVLGAAFLWRNWRTKDKAMLVVSAWFLVSLAAPLNQGAWRFAFVGLMPLTLMGGCELSKLKPKPFVPNKAATWAFLFLLLVPAFGSYSNSSFWSSVQYQGSVATQQRADWQAVQWMNANIPSCGHGSKNALTLNDTARCSVVSVNDFNLLYAAYVGGRHQILGPGALFITYAPSDHIIWSDPQQVQFFASTFGVYIAVAKNGPIALPSCDPRGAFGLSMSTNASNVAVGSPVYLNLASSVKGLNATVNLYEDGKNVAEARLVNGFAQAEAVYDKVGSHQLQAAIGFSAVTLPLNITVSNQPRFNFGGASAKVPSDFCQPWRAFNAVSMPGWTIIYQNEGVRIWRAPT